ncbi:Vps54-domain-containing protein [Dacryopinax primogenitus]|uniref:Vacuolar protein sorting-associated protein 54 n=1 Tax=Dacryopinax primogenitus (strain DJM 731) TaxID=1858805 RepID=M5G9R2_DACPD|nr:Vps54-domain-containing protein [Dacryopinax primogenitus]EJU05549.1 Vps54-domain-containing protein [Dacryopinax primogenitus]
MASRPPDMGDSPGETRPSSPAESDDETFSRLEQDPTMTVRNQAPYRFNWAKAGRTSMSEATESRVDLNEGHVGLGTLMQAMGSTLNLSAFPAEWSSSRTGFNAISTVLNNPHHKPAPLRPSRVPLPSVPPADLPRVRRKDFDAYLKSVSPEWAKFEKTLRERRVNPSSSGHITPMGFGTSSPGPSSSTSSLPPLSLVPPVYFDPEFNIGNPRTFAAVTEQENEMSRSVVLGEEDIAMSTAAQEKLSQYMDVVEQHLVQEIAQRSTSFFAALTNLQDLQTEGQQCLTRISKLRAELKEVDDKQAIKGLEAVRLQVKRDNIGQVMAAVKSIREVGETVGMAKHLIGGGEYFEALGLIEDVEESLAPAPWRVPETPFPFTPLPNGSTDMSTPVSPITPVTPKLRIPKQRSPAFDLAALKALSSLPEHLRELSFAISNSLETDLVGVLRADLSTRIRLSAPEDVASENDPVFSIQEATELRDRLIPMLQGLLRVKGVALAMKSYREAALAEVKTTVKMHLPSSDGEEDDPSGKPQAPKPLAERNAALAKELRELPLQDYLDLSKRLYDSLIRCIKAANLHTELVWSIIQPMLPPTGQTNSNTKIPTLSDLGVDHLLSDLSDIVVAVAEATNSRVSRIVALRQEQHSALDLKDFMPVFNVSWDFVIKCETLSQRMIPSLRGTMISQSKAFLLSFHASRLTQSATLVENEQWVQVEVSAASQHIVQIIVDCAISDPPELTQAAGATTNGTISGKPTKHIRVEDNAYYVVSATLDVLKLVLDYLRVMIAMSMLTPDVMYRIIEFLKAFNSRTCQVVLGAGAMRSAGLKNITAKHLALASQSLSIIISLISYVREAFRRHLSPTQAVMLTEFDKLKRDYQEHQNEIHAKLVAIMGDRLAIHVKSLLDMQLDAPKNDHGASPYMEMIVKETVTLHKVLSRYLSAAVVEYVMEQVLGTTNTRLGEEYGKIELPSKDAKARLLQDARYFGDKLGSLRGVNMPSPGMLEHVLTERSAAGETPSSPPPIMPRKSPFVGRRAFSALLHRATVEKKDDASPSNSPLPEKHVDGRRDEAMSPVPEKEGPAAMGSVVADSEDVTPAADDRVVDLQSPAPSGRDRTMPSSSHVDHVAENGQPTEHQETLPENGELENVSKSAALPETPEVPPDVADKRLNKEIPPLPQNSQDDADHEAPENSLSGLPPLPLSPTDEAQNPLLTDGVADVVRSLDTVAETMPSSEPPREEVIAAG